MSPPVKCLVQSNFEIACGAIFDNLKNPKKAVKILHCIPQGLDGRNDSFKGVEINDISFMQCYRPGQFDGFDKILDFWMFP